MTTPSSRAKLEKRRAELNRRWSRQVANLEAATARLAEAYLAIETIKTQIKAIDYDLDGLVDHKWQAVEEAHEELDVPPRRTWIHRREEDLSDEDSV